MAYIKKSVKDVAIPMPPVRIDFTENCTPDSVCEKFSAQCFEKNTIESASRKAKTYWIKNYPLN